MELLSSISLAFNLLVSQTAIPATPVKAAEAEYVMAVAGDVMFEAELGQKVKNGFDPFSLIREKWDGYDLRVVNLETNISTPGKFSKAFKSFNFNAPKAAIGALKNGGIDLVSLANNHAMDYGPGALLEQMSLLEKAGISYFGAGKNLGKAYLPKIVDLGSTKVALIGLNTIETHVTNATSSRAGTAPFNKSLVIKAIRRARKLADVVIVYPHWGVEHFKSPTADQKWWGRRFIDWGADLVVGAHPHVVQEMEIYKQKKIYYSLGNFIFVGMWNRPAAMRGQYLTITVKQGKIVGTKVVPYYLNRNGVPVLKNAPLVLGISHFVEQLENN